MFGVDYAKASGLGVGCHVGRCILLEAEPPAQSWLLSAELFENSLDFACRLPPFRALGSVGHTGSSSSKNYLTPLNTLFVAIA